MSGDYIFWPWLGLLILGSLDFLEFTDYFDFNDTFWLLPDFTDLIVFYLISSYNLESEGSSYW